MVFGQDYHQRKGENIDSKVQCRRELRELINRCLAVKRMQRFPNVEEVMKRLSQMQRTQVPYVNKESVTIAVAGAQAHIGATHFALMLCGYLKQRKISCIYVERNKSQAARALILSEGRLDKNTGLYYYRGVPILPYSEYANQMLKIDKQYQYLIYDCGWMKEEISEEFHTADRRFVILGAKEWELMYSKVMLKTLVQQENVVCFMNFLTCEQFKQVSRMLHAETLLRIPFEPQPIGDSYQKSTMLFLKDLIC